MSKYFCDLHIHSCLSPCADNEMTPANIAGMAMLNGLIMFVGLFGTANYFARLANFFLPAQVVVLPWMINKIRKSSNRDANIYAVACVGGYGLYFIYENYIVKRFDQYFAKTDLWSYISSHFGG